MGTPGQPAGQNTGAAVHRQTGDCRKGAAWLQGPPGGNGTDTGQELKDLLLAQELGTPVPRTLTHSCVATALGRQGPAQLPTAMQDGLLLCHEPLCTCFLLPEMGLTAAPPLWTGPD